MNELIIKTAGKKFSGWEEVTISKSMDDLAHSFDITLTDKWNANDEPIYFHVGLGVQIFIDDEKIITGYIDDISREYSDSSRRINIAGRSKTADLVDCSAIYQKGQWRGQTLSKIAKDLCQPLDISTSVASGIDVSSSLRRFSIEDGETIFDCISRAAKMAGVLLLTDVNGNLYFDRVSSTRIKTVLENGINILNGSKTSSMSDRYTDYTIKTQLAGDDTTYAAATSKTKTASDSGFVGARYRPLIITAENESSGNELQKRIDWEKNIRAGKSHRVSYTVQGWKHSTGTWAPNTLVRVKDPDFELDDELLIKSVQLTKNSQGTLASLELTFPQAYSVEPLPQQKIKGLLA